MKYYFTLGVQLNRKSVIKLILLYFSVYTFYYVIETVAEGEYGRAVGSQVLIFFNFGAAFSLLFSCLVFRHTRKMSIISVWALLSVVLLFLLLSTDHLLALQVLSSTIGISLGTTAWALSTYFITETRIEERGRVGGLITSITLLAAPILISLVRTHYAVSVFLSLIILLVTFLKVEETHTDRSADKLLPLFRKHSREFLLYLLPWLILCFNNSTFIHRVDNLLTEQFLEVGAYAAVLRYISAGFGALILGFSSDWIGRKPLIIGGLTMLGIAGCLSGILPNITLFLFFNIIAGFGWSFLLVAFLLIVWGEIPTKELSCIYFSVGLSAYYFSKGLEPLLAPLLLISLKEAALINASLVFISVILLVPAKNLLPSEIKEQMQFKLYLEQVKRRLKQGL